MMNKFTIFLTLFSIFGYVDFGLCITGKSLTDCQLIMTEKGNGGGGVCKIPFIYNQKIVFDTTNKDYLQKDAYWCSLTENYDINGLWGEASSCVIPENICSFKTYVKAETEGLQVTDPGADCVFPFTYTPVDASEPVVYYQCTTIDYMNKKNKWCGTTKNVDKNNLWAECTPACASKIKYCKLDTPSSQRAACSSIISATDEQDARNKCNEAGCCYDPFGNPTCFQKYIEKVDECDLGTHDCSSLATCTDADDGYTCTCKSGYTGNGKVCIDFDECSSLTCTGGTCENSVGSYKCNCKNGYSAGTDNVCKDTDECTTGQNNCHKHAHCNNTDGAYNCECRKGFTGSGFACECINWIYTKLSDKFAQGGTLLSGVNTVDECQATCNVTDACSSFDEHITNTSSVDCYWFGPGVMVYNASEANKHNHWQKSCGEEFDECKDDPPPCGSNAICTDTTESFTCTCEDGYTKDATSKNCIDIDECTSTTTPHTCPSSSECQNTEGSYSCKCEVGYFLENNACTSCFTESPMTQVFDGKDTGAISLEACKESCIKQSRADCYAIDYTFKKNHCYVHQQTGYEDSVKNVGVGWNISHFLRTDCF